MKKIMMNLFTRTPLHIGSGSAVGIVDAPVQRERHTRFPIIPGSALKGVLSDLWNEDNKRNHEGIKLFGGSENEKKDDNNIGGSLYIGEGRVLAFPVRSAKGMFTWLCCPLALNRFKRDSGINFKVPEISEEEVMAPDFLALNGKVILEEYPFKIKSSIAKEITDCMMNVNPQDPVWKELGRRLVIVSDEIFQHFCEHSCEVATRIAIDDEKGTVKKGALFNMEQIPSETLFYSLILSHNPGDIEKLKEKISRKDFLQIGGHASIGLGFCSVNIQELN